MVATEECARGAVSRKLRVTDVKSHAVHASAHRRSYPARMDLQFSGELWHWRGPSPFHFVTVPDGEAEAIQEVVTAG